MANIRLDYDLYKFTTLSKVRTSAVFKRFFLEQDGKCAICGKSFDLENNPKDCHLDHCHRSNVYRGLLCQNCNVGLGYFKDDIALFYKAIIYLNKKHGTLKKGETKRKDKQPKIIDIAIQLGMQLQRELESKK